MFNLFMAISTPSGGNYATQALTKLTDPGREQTLVSAQRLFKAKNNIIDSYRRVKGAFKTLQDKYVSSKENRNVVTRYAEMKEMIKEVLQLESQYWILIDLPRQPPNESQNDYINRVLDALDQRQDVEGGKPPPPPPKPAGISGILGQTAQIAEKAKEANQLEKLKAKSTDELRKEIKVLQEDLGRIIKKYTKLRALLAYLKEHYVETKPYPIIPRYSMLKELIRETLRSPAFVDVCHEQQE